ncbi:MAG: type IV pilus assembly protein PilM [Candidatus Firestonebacteria bacterium]|nr:type IV pilus assembly protein PilM [Candidatus Firestonebacteria bacterium]
MAHAIGLDIGSYSIKVSFLKEKAGKYILQNIGVADISEEPIDTLEPEKKNVLIQETLKRLIVEAGIKSKDVAISLSGDQVIARYIKLPYMTREELKGVIRYEAEQYIPFPIEQVVLDFHILGEVTDDGQKKIEVLLVAVKEDIVNYYIKLLESVGLNTVLIDIDTMALHNSFDANYEKKEGETVAIINMGAKFTNLSLIDEGFTRFSRDIPIGGIALTNDIAREFNLGFSESEKLKREHGGIIIESENVILTRIPSKEDKKVRIYSCISNTLGKLVVEIRRAFDFYESSSKKRNIGRVFLCGGTAKLQNMDKFVAERLKIPVEMHNPFNGIEIEKKDDPAFIEKVKQYSSLLPVSIGLAVRKIK